MKIEIEDVEIFTFMWEKTGNSKRQFLQAILKLYEDKYRLSSQKLKN